jgi:hypothetical protein
MIADGVHRQLRPILKLKFGKNFGNNILNPALTQSHNIIFPDKREIPLQECATF